MRKLSKNTILKRKKQKLCDRINQCKSLKELKGWEKTFSYYDVLKNNFDWDYDFLLDLIEFKLKRMREYFWTHNILENEKLKGDICDKLINILNAGYKTDVILDTDLHNYVNTRNIHRFFKPKELESILKGNLKRYYLSTVRETKAKALFWKFLHHYIEILWE